MKMHMMQPALFAYNVFCSSRKHWATHVKLILGVGGIGVSSFCNPEPGNNFAHLRFLGPGITFPFEPILYTTIKTLYASSLQVLYKSLIFCD